MIALKLSISGLPAVPHVFFSIQTLWGFALLCFSSGFWIIKQTTKNTFFFEKKVFLKYCINTGSDQTEMLHFVS